MATLTTPTYDRLALLGGGVGPSDAGGRYYESVVEDEEGLDVLNDDVKQIPIAAGHRVIEAGMELGDHDSSTSAAHSLILNDGAASPTESEIIKDATTGQAGGVVRLGGGTAADRVPVATPSTESFLTVKTTTAPGGLQTSDRYVRVWAYIQADP